MESFWQSDSGARTSRRVGNLGFKLSGRGAAAAILLTLASTSALAQDAINVTFPDSAKSYSVWIQDGYPNSLPTDLVAIQTKGQIQLANSVKTPTARVFVWDKATGTIADRKVSDAKDASWDVKANEFTDVPEVQISIQHDGKPVSAASVDLKDGARTQSQLLDSSAKGVISFFVVKGGKIDASVKYRSNGAMATPVNQSFELSAKGATPPVFKVALPDPVETVAGGAVSPAATSPGTPVASTDGTQPTPAGAPGTAATGAPARQSVQSSPFGTLIVLFVVLIAVLGAGYALMMFIKNNPEKAKATLEQLGAQIPKSPDDDMNAGIPAVPLQAPAPPQPIQKIMLGDSTPDPLGSVSPISSPSTISLGGFGGSAVAASPQLRSSSGDVIPISDVPLVVGRDPGLGLSLTGESTVSRKHAEVVKSGDSVVVRDLGSTNGTYVNGNRLQSDVVLRPGDEVQFGAIRFRYEG